MRPAIHVQYEVSAEDAGERLDRWLTDRLQEDEIEVSRTQVKRWLDDGCIRRARPGRLKPSDAVEAGDVYEVDVPEEEPVQLVPEEGVPFDVVYEDDDVLVVDKPRGVVVHPGAGHLRGTLVHGLLARGVQLSSLAGAMRPGVVHRIDKDTSGLVVFAKSDRAYRALVDAFRVHRVEREYVAIAHGRLPHSEGTVDMPIGRDPSDRQRMAVRPGGKRAVTHFEVLEQFANYTYLRLRLETGRTHQIRVHLAAIGHPIAGDPVYGPRHTLPIQGQALHARTLGFAHPDGGWLQFESPVPPDMAQLLEGLRQGRMGA
ncbi:RluA family pseudouridine synthase [Alicyclobacillus vulcanalis]|uniref:Pseudouridine synthase n=1 Tax=Alicyclobacillus vulcanalis TaxID=252246 RepID=A0A1N7NQH0_9BACL|nr:RluA family pseudouridine synthase [Alicyclobacillus vulcanalis]SIT00594.1 ribosomal large subunit pseudouridine synthase D [Alicyclobacillus vulcanalis]